MIIITWKSKIWKEHSRSRCTRFEECFLFDFDVARSEIIIKSSSETHHIINKWWCCCRRRWRRRDEKIDERRKVAIVDKVAIKHVTSYINDITLCFWNFHGIIITWWQKHENCTCEYVSIVGENFIDDLARDEIHKIKPRDTWHSE